LSDASEVLPRLCGLAVQADPLARLLGPAWQSMGYGTLADRASQLERAARFTRTLAHYMADTDAETAGEALVRVSDAATYLS
jgi:hypothetical protein